MSDLPVIRSPRLSHADYSDASVIRADKEIVLLAGVCPLNDEGAVVHPGDVAAQTRKVLENMDLVLSRCHVSLEDVAFLRILVVAERSEELGSAWTEVREHFGSHEMPATLQGVSVLGYPGQLVEIEPFAVRDPR